MKELRAVRLEVLGPELLRHIAADCIGTGDISYGDRCAEVKRLRLTCKALLSAAEAALKHRLVKVPLWPSVWPPPSMALLTRCARHLNLNCCGGQVTDEAVRLLAEATPDLVGLNLMGCSRVKDFAELASMTSLTWLSLRGTKVKVKDVSALRSLTALDLSGTGVWFVSALASMTSLTDLNLSDTSVKSVWALSSLTTLTSLNLAYNTEMKDVSALASMTSLTDLNLSGTGVKDISALALLTSLIKLDLSDTDVEDVSALAPLTSLTNLDLSYTDMEDVLALASIPNLTIYTKVGDVLALAAASIPNLNMTFEP